ncbi:hypothetical protein NPIL_675441 [Nephila pilipes]|uniref:Uncharacterized protein n=1 Tax=Nephila pilipes TaxID=299642 RepID=A0A8X6NBZ1_NEPPI|nr:hypothetical protein NPIL_675441 [Nephila pilipes]
MGWQFRVQRPPIRNISDLRVHCLNIWYNLSPVIYQGLVAFMSRRVKAVLSAKESFPIVKQFIPLREAVPKALNDFTTHAEKYGVSSVKFVDCSPQK